MPRREPDSPHTPDSHLSLFLRLPAGNEEDWKTFCGIYGPLIYRLACSSGLSGADADDAVAIVMQNLFKRMRKGFAVDRDPARFRSYLATAARRVIASLRRQRDPRRQHQTEQLASRAPSPADQIAALERAERLRFCVHWLLDSSGAPKKQVLAFLEYAMHGQPARDVAKRYGLTAQRLYTIKHEMLRKLQALRRQLDDDLGEV